MVKITFPDPEFRIKTENQREFIFDELRKKWVLLTPEEWVRQNILQYLRREKGYPAGLIAVEKEIRVGEMTKRYDILVYDKSHKPWLMVECKAMDVPLNEAVLRQALIYHTGNPVSFIVITNGQYTFCWKCSKAGLEILEELPEFT